MDWGQRLRQWHGAWVPKRAEASRKRSTERHCRRIRMRRTALPARPLLPRTRRGPALNPPPRARRSPVVLQLCGGRRRKAGAVQRLRHKRAPAAVAAAHTTRPVRTAAAACAGPRQANAQGVGGSVGDASGRGCDAATRAHSLSANHAPRAMA